MAATQDTTLDAGLATLRLRNAAKPYNPIADGPPDPPEDPPCTSDERSPRIQWEAATSLIEEALSVLSGGGLRLVKRYKCDWDAWIERDEFDAVKWAQDFPARFHKAFKAVRRDMYAIYQHGQRINGQRTYPSPVEAARGVLWPRIDGRVTDAELYLILSLANLADAIVELQKVAAHGDAAFHDGGWVADLINEAQNWIDAACLLEEAEASKRKALEAERAAHESDPDKLRGRKIADAALKGGHARRIYTEQVIQDMQAAVNAIHAENPRLSYRRVKHLAAQRYGWPPSALHRYSTNPKKS